MYVSANTYLKFAALAGSRGQSEKRFYLRSVFIEVSERGAFLVATNSRFAAVLFLGAANEAPFCANVTIDETLLAQLRAEAMFDSQLLITPHGVQTTFGFMYPGNPFVACNDSKNEFLTWRNWFEGLSEAKANGSMYINADDMLDLVNASPSGLILFPTKIDATKPIVVKDAQESGWLGIFVPWNQAGTSFEYGKLPQWVNE